MDSDYEYFTSRSFPQYAGEWIIIIQQKVVAHGPGRRMPVMMQWAKQKYPGRPVFVAKIPRAVTQIL
jgi:hypothetical protein